jgi:drug/metabolite transporter (DMT)-like permease
MKTALNETPPFLLAALRLCIAAPLLVLIQVTTRRPAIHTQDRWPLVRLSMIGIVASFVLAYTGISLTLSSDSSLLIVGEVIFTAIFAYVLLRERITRNRLIGLIVGTAGAVILITGAAGHNTETAPNRVLGDILVLGCLACESYYTVRGAAYLERNDSISMLAWVNMVSLVVWVPVLGYYAYTGELAQMSAATWGASVYMALVTSILCYFLWFHGVRTVGATVAAVALLFQPVVGALVGIQVMGDPITLTFIIGGVLVVGALLISGIPERTSVPAVSEGEPA